MSTFLVNLVHTEVSKTPTKVEASTGSRISHGPCNEYDSFLDLSTFCCGEIVVVLVKRDYL